MSNFDLFDHLYRSRKTILRILENRGYNIKPFEKFGINEIEAMVESGPDALRMDLELINNDINEQDINITKCRVVYSIQKLKLRLAGFINNLLNKDDDKVDPLTTEVIVMLADPEGEQVADTYHTTAYEQFSKNKLRISFFRIANLISHPADHVLVPKHEKTTSTFTAAEKIKLPIIRFHEDIQARILGLIPGDIIKITRPSPASGEYISYRICVP